MKKNNILRIAGVIIAIMGALSAIGGLGVMALGSSLGASFNQPGISEIANIFSFGIFIFAGLYIFAGWQGISHAENEEKGGVILGFGILFTVLQFFTLGASGMFGFLSLAASIIYIIGGYGLNKGLTVQEVFQNKPSNEEKVLNENAEKENNIEEELE